jgi:hypothetical protein
MADSEPTNTTPAPQMGQAEMHALRDEIEEQHLRELLGSR